MRHNPRLLIGAAALVLMLAISVPSNATTVLRMDLEEMVQRSGTIFRGTVEDFRTGSIEVGGGTLPTVTYVFQVEEGLKGDFGGKTNPTIEVTMLGAIKDRAIVVNGQQRLNPLPSLPSYSIGSEYLVILTPQSAAGLSVSVGLEQGTFRVFNQDHADFAVNALDNQNLGSGISGPIRYDVLAGMIRELVSE